MLTTFLSMAFLGLGLIVRATAGPAATGRRPFWRARAEFSSRSARRRYVVGTLAIVIGAFLLAASILMRMA